MRFSIKKFIVITFSLVVLITLPLSLGVKINTNYYCCESPTVRWRFAIYCGECDAETGCHYEKIKGTGVMEYLDLKGVECAQIAD